MTHQNNSEKDKKTDEVNENKSVNNKNKSNGKRTFKGLCMNCKHRFTCTLPRPETGVWYCEEYE